MNLISIKSFILSGLLFLSASAALAEDPASETGGFASKIGNALTGDAEAIAISAVGLAVSGQALSSGVTQASNNYVIILGGAAEQAAEAISDDDSAHGHGSGHGE